MRAYLLLSLLAASGLVQTARARQAPAKQLGPIKPAMVWRDPATKLTWAAADNGVGVSASQAEYYCANLTLDGHKDWRLPQIEELHGLFGGTPDDNGHHIVGPIRITGWAWSETPGQARGEQWALDFGDGGRASAVTGDSGLNRALCVRGKITGR
jgi:Protein of unknown function (DUF1566)